MADIRVKDLSEASVPGEDYYLLTDSATDGVKKVKTTNVVKPADIGAASLTGVETLTNKTLTAPTITGATITTSTYNGNIWTAGTGTLTLGAGKTATISNTLTFTGTDGISIAFGSGGAVAYQGSSLVQFAATTSAQLAGVISDETGTGALVFATSPTLVTPTLGAASATSINKVALTAPATSATLTIADGKTLTASDNATVSGTNTGDQTITLTGDVTGSGTGSFAASIGATKVTSAMLNADVFSTAHSWSGVQTFTNPVVGTQTAGDNSTKAASTAFVQAAVTAGVSGVASLNGQTGALKFIAPPQGRLTLTSGTAVMASSVAAATALYYTPAVGNQIPLYDGSNMVPTVFSELSAANTGIGNSKVSDWFVWNNSGTVSLTFVNRASDTAAGDFVVVNGIRLNNSSITSGPAAQRGTYVGTTRTDASGNFNWILGGSDTAAVLGVWNAYNQKMVSTSSWNSASSWTYGSAAIRQSNGTANCQAGFVIGVPEITVTVDYMALINIRAAVGGFACAGIALNSTTSFDKYHDPVNNAAQTISASITVPHSYSNIKGFNFISANELGDGLGVSTYFGGQKQNLRVSLMM